MDYKFRQVAVLIASIMVLVVLVGVLIGNRNTIKRRASRNSQATVSVTASTEEMTVSLDGSDTYFGGEMVGTDLSAWKSDPLFFGDKNAHVSEEPVKRDVSSSDVSGQPDVSSADTSDKGEKNTGEPPKTDDPANSTSGDGVPDKDEDPLNNGAG